MARLIPDPVPEYVRVDPLRSAELRVYEALRRLPGSYVAYYSRPWLGITPQGGEVEGECDFVIAHPEFGLFVLEVKGGGVSRDGSTDQWFSRDRLGIQHMIKNPVLQAGRGKHSLLEKLKAAPGWRPRYIAASRGVVLPDSARAVGNLGADMPQELFAFAEDMPRLHEWVLHRMEHPGTGARLGADGMTAVERLLAGSFQLRTPLNCLLGPAEAQILTLTEQQLFVLDGLAAQPWCAVAGGAGTGKTVLAVEKARRLAQDGAATLLLCYNRALARGLRDATAGVPNLRVESAHGLAASLAPGVALPAAPEQLGEILLDALGRRSDLRFDGIVVDEAQDLGVDCLAALQLALRHGHESTYYLFYDDNQRIYGAAGRIAGLVPHPPFRLTRNLRNTRQIFDAAIPFYGGGSLFPAGPQGPPVDWIVLPEAADLARAVERRLDGLIRTDHVAPGQIAILSGVPLGRSRIHQHGKVGGWSTRAAAEATADQLTLDSVWAFKGLERNVVILAEISGIIDRPELIYVALTRARLHMVVMGGAEELAILNRPAGGASRSDPVTQG